MSESVFRNMMELRDIMEEHERTKGDGKKRSEIVGEIITGLRLKRGYTQQEISDAIGIARQTYAGYERGYHEPSIESLIALAEIYGVSLDYITGRYEITNIARIKSHVIDDMIEKQETDEEIMEQIELHEFREQRRKYNRVKKRSPSQG